MTPQSDVALAPLCTMAVGGPARWLVSATSQSEICAALAWAAMRETPVYVLGGGSNLLVADNGVEGLVIHVNIRGVETRRDGDRAIYTVGAGEPWDPLVAATVRDESAGVECLSGIPGCAGGTPVQNVGAYGQDVSHTITRVQVVDRRTRAAATFSNSECAFGYRTSRFKREDLDRYIVTGVEFSLAPGGRPTVEYADVVHHLQASNTTEPTLAEVRDAVLTIRRRKGMVIEPGNAANRSCGSFFVNPIVSRDHLRRVEALAGAGEVPHYVVSDHAVKMPAAWLIEQAGFPKGTTRGEVAVSPFQAQAIINLGRAAAADVVDLACDIKRAVWAAFQISIVPEPVFVGFHPSADLTFLLTHAGSH